MRSYGFMLCGRFYISSPSLLVTVARGSKVPGPPVLHFNPHSPTTF